MKYIFPLFFILSFGCHQTNSNADNKTGQDIFSTYDSQLAPFYHSQITLRKDSSYTYYYGGCVFSGLDSGKFTILKDTLFFKSFLENKVDTSNHGFDQIRPLTGEKYLLRNGRIYLSLENGKYDKHAFLLKMGLEATPEEILDSTGNGFATFYNGERQRTKEGQFEKFKLKSGFCYSYLKNGEVGKIEIYENGIKVRDSIPVK